MAQKVKFVSPFGTAQYPHISAPDTVGKFADGKYKTKLTMPAGDPAVQAFVSAIREAARTIHGAKGESMYMPFTLDEETNTVTFIAKTSYEPAVFDSRNNPVKGVKIGGGSVLRLMGNLVEFEKGVSAQMNQVQVKELNGFGSSGFDTVEGGYEADASASTAPEPPAESAGTPNAALDI